jgi:branched-chain amino acid transport system substrate-binding protein
MKTIGYFFLLLSILVSGCSKNEPSRYAPIPAKEIRIGVLLALSGSGFSSGESAAVALELARTDIQFFFESAGIQEKLVLDIVDTKTDTAEALKQLAAFYDKGIRLVIGPYSSAELAHIKNFADSHGMLIVSPSSVAVSLAVPNDNIFRFVTSDVIQGKAMSKLLVEDKIKVVVPIIRNDVWGNDLIAATAGAFEKTGGIVQPPVKFEPGTVDFENVLDELDNAVAVELEHHNPNDVAIYLLSFAEGTRIVAEAKKHANLNYVYWYGASAFAQNVSALNDTNAALFSYTHGLPCPLFGLDDAAKFKWEPLRERIQSVTGRVPDVYSFSAYDALWVLVKAYRSAGGNVSIDLLKSAFVYEADNYYGVSGNTQLDENGDRAFGNYDFWAIKSDTLGYAWKRVARYNSLNGTLLRIIE